MAAKYGIAGLRAREGTGWGQETNNTRARELEPEEKVSSLVALAVEYCTALWSMLAR